MRASPAGRVTSAWLRWRVGYSLVIMAWYGVNFVLGAGLHSYGFGGGGKLFMGTLIGAQSLYAAVALWRSRGSETAGVPHLRARTRQARSPDRLFPPKRPEPTPLRFHRYSAYTARG